MKCPICKSVLLRRTVAGNEMYFCSRKHGISINVDCLGDVIRSLASQSETPNAEIKDVFHLSGPERAVDENRICPECNQKMKTFNYAYNSNIFLDRCYECGNVWIDAEEFSTLISYVKGNPKIDNLGGAISEYEDGKREEKDAIQNMNSMRHSTFGARFGLANYISRELFSKRTPVLTKVIWIIIIGVLLFLYIYYKILRW